MKVTTITETIVQKHLYRYLEKKNHNLISPNVMNIYPWECDMISLTTSNMVHEYEIKTSKQDFLNDCKKTKHKHFKNKKNKTPSYFWYVCVGFEVDLKDIPEYAGLMYGIINPRGNKIVFIEQKKAPRLNQVKLSINDCIRLYRSIYFRFWKQKLILLD